MADGIETRHLKGCDSEAGRRCSCQPSYRVVIRGRNGKVTRTFHRLADAREWRATAKVDVLRTPRLAGKAPTVRVASDALIAAMATGGARTRSGDAYKPRVVRDYRDALEAYALPVLGELRLDEVTLRDVQAIADRLLAAGRAPSSVRNAVMPLRVLYRRALRDGHVASSPCDHLELPAVRGKRERIASPAEAEKLLAALTPRDRALWGCAFYAGLRLGEIQALRRPDVDLGAGIIHVRHGWDRLEGLIEPKSRAGVREVIITAGLRDYLTEHLMTRSSGFVFGASPSRPFTESAVRNRTQRAWRKAGLTRITLHEARHTCASIFIAAGMNPKALSEMLGHSDISTTFNIYGHLMPGARDEARELVDAYLERAAR